MISPLKIGTRLIGPGHPVFIVAEISANHHHDLNQAHQIIDAAVTAGCDAVKLQTYTADTMTIDASGKWFRIKGTGLWDNKTLYELYNEAYTPWEWHQELQEHAIKRGLVFFSTPFDKTAVDFLENLQVPLYKIASFEAEDIPLLQYIGRTKKPVILSRGLSEYSAITQTINTLYTNGAPAVAVLHCVSTYPAKPMTMKLAHIPQIMQDFQVVSGLSDHSLNPQVSLIAVALGASIIEKHLTLDRHDWGADSAFSLKPDEMKYLVTNIRALESLDVRKRKNFIEKIQKSKIIIGKADYKLSNVELKNKQFKRSLFAVQSIEKNEPFTLYNVRSIRPGYGLEPKYLSTILGKKAAVTIKRGMPLSWKLIQR